VVVPPDIATYQLETVAAGLEYRVTLRLRDGLRDGKLQGDVEIFTDHPDESSRVSHKLSSRIPWRRCASPGCAGVRPRSPSRVC
jgi:hypothetical protein